MGRLSAAQLRSLCNGPRVKLMHAINPKEAPQVLFDAIPKNMVTYFSAVLKDCFPSKDTGHANRPGCDGKEIATVYGGLKQAFIIVFDWMVKSCEGRGLIWIERMNYTKYARIFEAAKLLDVELVYNDMLARMNKMANTQIRVEEVRKIYQSFPKNSEPRQIVIRSIGDAVFDRRLRAWALYKEFKIECREYDDDIYEYVQSKHRVIAEERKQRQVRNRGNMRRAGQSQPQQDKEVENTPDPKAEDQVVTKKVTGVVSRKGKGGHPSYVKITLDKFGVDNADYRSHQW
ncbi:uncharacterized protein GIQ15_01096 [Arthroderma uncinatum]|uniref:uncharacterized protein n=1 Tax=Arthroderma uncinatum TaxID=74035 RepID=UPI00144AF523|nr:uncharacterized protein GIQ15_01096 [Arthroderma uncinatum]KAF3491579.1 hypothetical protein GIQ15_01096 [Arthroderma uncinatum]